VGILFCGRERFVLSRILRVKGTGKMPVPPVKVEGQNFLFVRELDFPPELAFHFFLAGG